jgi:hypothetical protein
MGFALSPSVNVKEIDLSTIVPAVATSICAVAGVYQWGPCFDKQLVTNQKDLIRAFGYPSNDGDAKHWWSASNFLAYGNTLYVTRCIDADGALNSGLYCLDTTIGNPASVPTTKTAYLPNAAAVDAYQATFTLATDKLQVFAKYPGVAGDTFKIAISNAVDWETAELVTGGDDFADVFEFGPADYWDEAVEGKVYLTNEADSTYFGIVVMDSANVILEQFLVSADVTAKDFEGNSLYVENHINQNSSYINVKNNTNSTVGIDSFVGTALAGGAEGTIADGDFNLGYDEFANSEEFDVSIIMDGGNAGNPVVQKYIIDSICETRKDCIAVLSVPYSAVVGVAASTAATYCADYKTSVTGGQYAGALGLGRASSYGSLYGNWKQQYDKFNDAYVWVPMSGDAAGIYAHTDEVRDPWFAPAGLNRGQVKGVVKLAFSPNRAQRDTMYKSQVNPVVNFASDGPVIFGQKTLQSKPSAFDRVDVRRLFIVLEKAIATASRYFLFEKNTTFTRRQMVGMIEPFLRRVQGREGIYEFHVECSEVNNTPQVIDANELVCDIFIQPTKSAEFISLNFIATRTGVDFNEYIGKSF